MEKTRDEKEAAAKAFNVVLAVVFVLLMLALLSGCATETHKEYYESGQLKSEYLREGFVSWSDGDGKTINLPLANPHVNAVGK
jgi:hypothetical protein